MGKKKVFLTFSKINENHLKRNNVSNMYYPWGFMANSLAN